MFERINEQKLMNISLLSEHLYFSLKGLSKVQTDDAIYFR